jgi:hypothetical protein
MIYLVPAHWSMLQLPGFKITELKYCIVPGQARAEFILQLLFIKALPVSFTTVYKMLGAAGLIHSASLG